MEWAWGGAQGGDSGAEPVQGLGHGEEALGWRHSGGNVLHSKPLLSTAVLSAGEVFMLFDQDFKHNYALS